MASYLKRTTEWTVNLGGTPEVIVKTRPKATDGIEIFEGCDDSESVWVRLEAIEDLITALQEAKKQCDEHATHNDSTKEND